jgi:non-ribosomal peptide synthetase component F
VRWGREYPHQRHFAEWRRYLGGFDRPTPLPVRGARSASPGFSHHRGELGGERSEALARFARAQRVTRYTQVLAAWSLVLDDGVHGDVVFGTAVAGRPVDLPDIETTVGLFINTVPVRVVIPDQGSAGDWLRGLQAEQAALAPASHVPLRAILPLSEIPRSVPLFQTLVVYQNYPEHPTTAGLRAWPLASVNHTSYPVVLVVSTSSDGRTTWRVTVDESQVDSRSAAEVAELFGRYLVALTDDDIQSLRSVRRQEGKA